MFYKLKSFVVFFKVLTSLLISRSFENYNYCTFDSSSDGDELDHPSLSGRKELEAMITHPEINTTTPSVSLVQQPCCKGILESVNLKDKGTDEDMFSPIDSVNNTSRPATCHCWCLLFGT